MWGHTPVVSALKWLRKEDFYEFKANLDYIISLNQTGLHRKNLT